MTKILKLKGAAVKALSVWAALAYTAAARAFAAGTAVLGGSAELANLTRVTMDRNDPNAAVFSSAAASGVLDWTRFNVGAGQSMSFNGANTTFFNLVDGAAGKSQIDGIINGSGNVWVINPAGIAFGAGASVDVGGLFAAAAGNLENAAALRNGTAAMPVFASFEGAVEATKGTFSAEQVALLGRKVTAGGSADFADTLALTVGAGESLAVDDVGGGLVSVSVATAAEFADAEVNIDGLLAGNAFVEVVSDGDIGLKGGVGAGELSVAATRSVIVDGDVRTAVGGFSAASVAEGDVVVNGSVTAAGDVSVTAAGDVRVEGALVSSEGNVTALAGTGSAGGDVVIGADGTVSGTDRVTLLGDSVTSAGRIDVQQGSLEVYGRRGDVNLFDQARGVVYAGDVVLVAEGDILVDNPNNRIGKVTRAEAGPGKSLRINIGGGGEDADVIEIGGIVADTAYIRTVKGTIKVIGDITAPDLVYLQTEDGDIIVMENCVVTATGSGAVVRLAAGRDIVNDGTVASDGVIDLAAGRDIGGEGAVAAADAVSATAGGSVKLRATDALKLGEVRAKGGDIEISTESGDIVVDRLIETEAADGVILLKAATDPQANGSIVVTDTGALEAAGENGAVIGIAGYGKLKASGRLEEVDGVPRRLLAAAGALRAEGGSSSLIELDERATVMAGRLIFLEGLVGVVSAGTIDARQAELEVHGHTGDVNLYADNTGVVLAKQATLTTEQNILAENPNNQIDGVGEIQVGADKTVKLNMGSIDEGFGGEVTTFDAANVGDLNEVEGTILVTGDITTPDSVMFVSEFGDVIIMKGCTVKTTGDHALAYFSAGRDVVVSGKVAASGEGGEIAVDSRRDVRIGEEGSMVADGRLSIGGKTSAVGGKVALNGVAQAEDVVVAANQGAVEVGGTVTADNDLTVTTRNGAISVGGTVTADNDFTVTTQDGAISVGGTVTAGKNATFSTHRGAVEVRGTVAAGNDAYVSTQRGEVGVAGQVRAGNTALVSTQQGNVRVSGKVDGAANAFVQTEDGGVTVSGRVSSDEFAAVESQNGGITVDGAVEGPGVILSATRGDLTVNGRVDAAKGSDGVAILQTKGSGNVVLGSGGEVRSSLGVVVQTESGNLVQRGGPDVSPHRGRTESRSLKPALSGENVVMVVNGSVGGEGSGSIAIDGKPVGIVSGDARIAVANGKDLVGGTSQEAAKVVDAGGGFLKLDLSALGENSAMVVGGDLSLYTAGGIGNYTTFDADGDVSLSAATFGDTSYLRAGGNFAVNNVGSPSHPQIAYFESVNGREPKIVNQANDMVIFIDGRLVGGNLQIINQFGANEAFMVETPELKSTQGIFGDPPFLHSDLDVANPMEVCAIDYLIQEIPRLTLSSDFPPEVDKNVAAVGLSPKDVYWFGQKRKEVDTNIGDGVTPDENTVETEEEKEKVKPQPDDNLARIGQTSEGRM